VTAINKFTKKVLWAEFELYVFTQNSQAETEGVGTQEGELSENEN